MSVKYPAYPLLTLDPFTSIWSPSERLNDQNTIYWTGRKMPVYAYITVDGKRHCLMGKGANPLPQTSVKVTPLNSEYVFDGTGYKVTLLFRTPMRMDVTESLAYPFSYIDYRFEATDGASHDVAFCVKISRQICYNKCSPVSLENVTSGNLQIAKMGRKKQAPLSAEGDSMNINWGYAYLTAENGKSSYHRGLFSSSISNEVCHSAVQRVDGFFVFAYDDVYSIDYFDVKTRGYWHKKFGDIIEAIQFAVIQHDQLLNGAKEFEQRLLDNAAAFGEDYVNVISIAYRQVVAAHKLIEDEDGNLLYLSKECHSNGCINTVDVSYPSIPLICLYNPALLTGFMTAIFKFAKMPCWTFDFAPHDVGTYPRVSGQVYGSPPDVWTKNRTGIKKVYTYDYNPFPEKGQQPVEECGDMLIMCYVYYKLTGDLDYIGRYFDLLTKWADYLVQKGVVLQNQLCTDDFAGHLEKNINLAIKSVMGLKAFSMLAEIIAPDVAEHYATTAAANARQIEAMGTTEDGKLLLAFDTNNTWSLKYNMVWDVIWNTGLFSESVKAAEIKYYKENQHQYGIPLDSRSDYTKSDWIMWAACLDTSDELIKISSQHMVDFLQNTKPHVPFSDWYYTSKNLSIMFRHRTVQGGLWMPVLARRWDSIIKA